MEVLTYDLASTMSTVAQTLSDELIAVILAVVPIVVGVFIYKVGIPAGFSFIKKIFNKG